jgi:RNA polymerase sigma-70 factor (sigma-E family)
MARDDEFEHFVAARSKALMRLAFLLTANAASAEDLLQTALVRAYVRWSRISESPEAYVRRVLVNAAIDQGRRHSTVKEKSVAELPEPAEQRNEYANIDDRLRLRRALEALPARQRAAVVLRHWLDMDVAQVAAVMGCSEGTVRSQALRGLEKLRATLTGLESDERVGDER